MRAAINNPHPPPNAIPNYHKEVSPSFETLAIYIVKEPTIKFCLDALQ